MSVNWDLFTSTCCLRHHSLLSETREDCHNVQSEAASGSSVGVLLVVLLTVLTVVAGPVHLIPSLCWDEGCHLGLDSRGHSAFHSQLSLSYG